MRTAGAVAALLVLGACSAPAASQGPPPEPDPCALIRPDQAKRLALSAPGRTDLAGVYTGCRWSTPFGSAVGTTWEGRLHTVDQFVAAERAKAPALTTSAWTGRHRGIALDWRDGHGTGVVIAVDPARIVTVFAYDGGDELGRRIPDVLRDTAAVVDGNLP